MVAVYLTGDDRVTDKAAAAANGVVICIVNDWIADARARQVVAPVVDDLGIGKANLHVETAGTEFLEVGRLARTDERLVRLAAVERIGLQPLLAARDAIRRREGLDFIEAGIQILDNRLTRKRR